MALGKRHVARVAVRCPIPSKTSGHAQVQGGNWLEACLEFARTGNCYSSDCCVSFMIQQRLACSEQSQPGWTAKRQRRIFGSIPSGSRNTLRSSWTETAGGPAGGICPEWPGIARVSKPCARQLKLQLASIFRL